MHPWSQLTSLSLAIIGFSLALIPRRNPLDRNTAPRNERFAVLIRWPGFWGGLALLAYIVIQGCNPSWKYVSDSVSWWLEPLPHVDWLPSGIQAPFARSNPWRALVTCASIWLVVNSVWIGFTRRKSYRVLFTLLVANSALIALLSLLQKLTRTEQIFWIYAPSNSAFTASFIYPNHAGAYLNLMVALAAGLAFWSYRRERFKLEEPGQAWIFIVLSLSAAMTVVFSYSRASIALLFAFAALLTVSLGTRWLWRRVSIGSRRARLTPFALALAGVLVVSLTVINSQRAWSRFNDLLENPQVALKARLQVRDAAWTMLGDRWLLGWGAGSFRHGFPLYAQNYPDIYQVGVQGGIHWEHAHDDLIEIPLELGLAGILPVVIILIHGIARIARRRLWDNPVSISMFAACGLLTLHANVDFVLQCPAVLVTAAVFFFSSQRWAELDNPRSPDPQGHETGTTKAPDSG